MADYLEHSVKSSTGFQPLRRTDHSGETKKDCHSGQRTRQQARASGGLMNRRDSNMWKWGTMYVLALLHVLLPHARGIHPCWPFGALGPRPFSPHRLQLNRGAVHQNREHPIKALLPPISPPHSPLHASEGLRTLAFPGRISRPVGSILWRGNVARCCKFESTLVLPFPPFL